MVDCFKAGFDPAWTWAAWPSPVTQTSKPHVGSPPCSDCGEEMRDSLDKTLNTFASRFDETERRMERALGHKPDVSRGGATHKHRIQIQKCFLSEPNKSAQWVISFSAPAVSRQLKISI